MKKVLLIIISFVVVICVLNYNNQKTFSIINFINEFSILENVPDFPNLELIIEDLNENDNNINFFRKVIAFFNFVIEIIIYPFELLGYFIKAITLLLSGGYV